MYDETGYCSNCGAPLTVRHTRSHTCRACQMHAAKLRQRLPPWDVIEANMEKIVAQARLEGSCFTVVDVLPAGPIMGHKL